MNTALVVRGLTLRAGGRSLVERLDLQADAGQRWCVIGRNAAGKSTLLRALAGLAVPALQGEVRWQGHDPRRIDAAAAAPLRAYMAQHTSDRFALPVRDWLALHARAEPAPAALQALARQLDVEPLLARAVTELSGGERQRVGLAALALQDAALWLLDEPVSFQDPAQQRLVSDWLAAQTQRLVLMSAHDMNWVQRSASHVVALLPGGGWRAGACTDVLDADTLQQVFGCPWRRVDGRWMPA